MTAAAQGDQRLALIDTINRYCQALDLRDWDRLASLFAADAVLKARRVERGIPGPEIAQVVGRDAVVASIRHMWEGLSSTHHMVTNHLIEVAPDGRTAAGSCGLRAYHAGGGAKAQLFEESLARFDFEAVREGGGEWRIRLWDEAIFVMLGDEAVFGPG